MVLGGWYFLSSRAADAGTGGLTALGIGGLDVQQSSGLRPGHPGEFTQGPSGVTWLAGKGTIEISDFPNKRIYLTI